MLVGNYINVDARQDVIQIVAFIENNLFLAHFRVKYVRG